jgi:light-regulated signal transduction histidine kinase (bacteriophytochrome)
LQATIGETGAQVSSGYLPSIVGYEAQLSQLFQNLIGNAIKYRSERPPRVYISAEKHGHEWIFKVRDNGIGIAPEYYKTIFGVFKRLHGKETPGTGIGLAICSKVVEHHGGRIWVESKFGEGSEFCFTLPEYWQSSSGERDRN